MRAVDQFHALFGRLFSRFLDLRLDDDQWPAETERIRQWVASKAAEADPARSD